MRQKGFVFLPVLIIIALVGVLGYFVYQNNQLRKNQIITITPTNTPATDIASASPSPNPISDWKTYSNNLYSLKYPTHWILNDLTNGEQVEIYFQPDRNKSVGSILIERLKQVPPDLERYKEEKKIGNKDAVCMSDNTVKKWCYIPQSNFSILIISDSDSVYNQTLDLILTTLNFTQ